MLRLIIIADDEGLVAGEDPKQRSFQNVIRVMRNLRPDGFILSGIGVPAEVEQINRLLSQLYRPNDIGVGGVHLGAFMFRDVFCRLSVPIVFGNFGLDALNQTDLSLGQKKWLLSLGNERARLNDQFLDLFDFGYGVMEINHTRKVGTECENLLGLAHFQLESAAATVTGAYDLRGAVQSALLAVELALKSCLAANGVSLTTLKQEFGHSLSKMVFAIREQESHFDAERVLRTLKTFPQYVPNRYSSSQPARVETGHIVMGAQYIGSEVTRQLTDRNLRLQNACDARSYPP